MIPAENQIAGFVDRILRARRIEARTSQDLKAIISPREARLEYALVPLVGLIRSTVAADRAFTAAAALMGCKSDIAVSRAWVWARRGSLAAIDAFLQQDSPLPLWTVAELRHDLVGYVYGVEAPEFPGIVKVGFSSNPKRRTEKLSRQLGIDLRLVIEIPGTKLEEHLIQHGLHDHGLGGEWFDLDGRWRLANPAFRFMTPEFMWKEILKQRGDLA